MAHIGSPHPERRPGEVFITYANQAAYALVGWVTKRKGERWLDEQGQDRNDPTVFPVFAETAELAKAGLAIQ